jgi:hypothetical protein
MAGNATININAVDNTRAAFLDVQRNISATKTQAGTMGRAFSGGFGTIALSIAGPIAAFQALRRLITSVISDVESIPGVSPEAVQSITSMKNSFQDMSNSVKLAAANTIDFFIRLPENVKLTILALATTKEQADLAKQALDNMREANNRAAEMGSPEYKEQVKQLQLLTIAEMAARSRIGETKTQALEFEKKLQGELIASQRIHERESIEFHKLRLELAQSYNRADKLRLEIEKDIGKEVKLADPIAEQMTAFEQSVFNTFDRVGDRASQLFADMVLTGKASFGQLADIVARSMLEVVARMAIINPLLNMMFGGFSGFQALPTFFGGPRAGGGQVSTGKSYLVGERGPEMFSPSSAGHITQNSKLGGGSSQTYYIDARGADQTGLARLEGMIRETRASIRPIALASVMDTRARGGAMGRAA